QILLAEKLCEISGLSRVFFSNSGTEAIEGAIKLVRRWGSALGKNELIAFSGGFHGRTLGALSIMDKPVYKDKMGPFVENCKVIEYNNPEELKKHVSEGTAAVFFECIQGEGGISGISEELVKAVKELKQKYNFLVVADEIQSGIGRTGKYFAYQHFDFVPDVVTSSKAMGGGLPLGAIIAGEHLANVWEKTMHGTTFGGNAVACAAGLATITELQNGVLENVNKVGDYLKSKLTDLQKKYSNQILEVRGKGLMQGLLLSFDASKLVNALIEKHRVITNAASGKVLRLVPPLIITTKEVDILAEAIDKCLEEV
nr:aminotransferase class III-fold pyridoxal phosphate-dependent enzyme [Candidatus Kapabacteria bacterium]